MKTVKDYQNQINILILPKYDFYILNDSYSLIRLVDEKELNVMFVVENHHKLSKFETDLKNTIIEYTESGDDDVIHLEIIYDKLKHLISRKTKISNILSNCESNK